MVDFPLFKVSPHQWGPGKTHLVDEVRGTTFCGKAIEDLVGEAPDGPIDLVTCRGCLNAIERRKTSLWDRWTDTDWIERCGGKP